MNEVIELRFESEPGDSFQYKPDPQIMVYLLEEIYGVDITQLLKTYASGFGGQYLIIIPQEKITISILSDMDRPHQENKDIIALALQL